MINAERSIDVAPRRKPNAGPKTRALRIKTNHIGSIPTAPVPSGRTAAINAERSAKRATDFASKSPLLTLARKSASAMGVDARKIHCGLDVSDATKNGHTNPARLTTLTRANEIVLPNVKVKIFFVFISHHLVQLQHHPR